MEVDVCSRKNMVQRHNADQYEASDVRDYVFNRVKKYMNYVSCRYLWMGKHCIEQTDGIEKEKGHACNGLKQW